MPMNELSPARNELLSELQSYAFNYFVNRWLGTIGGHSLAAGVLLSAIRHQVLYCPSISLFQGHDGQRNYSSWRPAL